MNYSRHRIRLRIVHETDPEKYFPAVISLASRDDYLLIGTYRYSIAKEWIRSRIAGRRPLGGEAKRALVDLGFRIRSVTIQNETIIAGFAPWDWRMIFFLPVIRRNLLIYHTSWPRWDVNQVARRYGPLTWIFSRIWLHVLRHPNVRVVAVLEASRIELLERHNVQATVVPHAVPEEFFNSSRLTMAETCVPLRLIYVGELSYKKGLDRLLSIVQNMEAGLVELTIVGDGPLRDLCVDASAVSNIRYLGAVTDREVLAEEMAGHDVLVLLSRREAEWEELFGIVLIEAIAAGLGVISSSHIGPVSIFGDRELGNLFADQDQDGPTELIQRLAADPAYRRKFREGHVGLAEPHRLSRVAEAWDAVISAGQGRGARRCAR